MAKDAKNKIKCDKFTGTQKKKFESLKIVNSHVKVMKLFL